MTGTTGRPDRGPSGTPVAERLAAWAGARAAPNASDAARVLEQVSGQRPELTTKRSLIAVSHAIEQAVIAAPRAEPTIVLALFQRMEYFERERAAYERIARTGARVAVGFCDGPDHPLPDGVAHITLEPGEALVDEWSVVAVTPEAGAFLVATDQHGIEPGAPSLEAGRRFRSRWGFSRVQATVELARLRLTLGERLPADMVRTIDRLLGQTMSAGADPASSSGTPQEVWATAAAFHLAERLTSARTGGARLRAQLTDAHAAATARHAAGSDPQSGLTTPEFLHRWSDGDGTTVLPVGIALLDLPAVVEAGRGGADPRAAYHAARRIAAAVTQPIGPVDAAVRLSEREFLVVIPGASELHLARVCDDIMEQLTLASDGYPYVPLSGRLATTVTRTRPLPLGELRDAIARVDETAADAGPRQAGVTAGGDPVVVCTTRPAGVPGSADLDATDGAADPDDAAAGPGNPTASAESGDGTLVIGHGRFPRPFPPFSGTRIGDGDAGDVTPAGGLALGRPADALPDDDAPGRPDALDPLGAGRDASGAEDGEPPWREAASERTDALRSRHERSASDGPADGSADEVTARWDRPPGEPSGPGEQDGRSAEPPWRPRPDGGALPPATAVDEVRNLFGRRN